MLPEARRPSLYFNSPDFDEIERILGRQRLEEVVFPLFAVFDTQPSISLLRGFSADLLWELYNDPQEARESGYSSIEIMYSIAFIQMLTTHPGILLGSEVEQIHKGERIDAVDQTVKYAPWKELVSLTDDWRKEGKIVGMTHGAFDPVHIGHGKNIRRIWPYCDKVVVGFDPNWYIRQRKGQDRPRFPQLAWRMWEIASLPTVDKVFVLPFTKPNLPTDDDFFDLYRMLGIRILGTDPENPLLSEYEKRMSSLGGFVITSSGDVSVPKEHSSTRMFSILERQDGRIIRDIAGVMRFASKTEAEALKTGYLKDYPDLTD